MKTYVITEGQSDAELLRTLLPGGQGGKVQVEPGGSRSSAISLSRSLLAKRRAPVLVVLDADTRDRWHLDEQSQIVQDLLRDISPDVQSSVVLVPPSIDAIYFQDRQALERVLGEPLSDQEWHDAAFDPTMVLSGVLKRNNLTREALLERASRDRGFLRQIARHPSILEIKRFIEGPNSSPRPAPSPVAQPAEAREVSGAQAEPTLEQGFWSRIAGWFAAIFKGPRDGTRVAPG